MAELFKVNAPVRKPLFEGVQGENEARSIQFDIEPWVTELGDGVVTATAKRSQDSQPYPVTVTKDGNIVTWKPTSTDTAYAGVGSFQLEYTVDSVLAKTCIWSTMVAPSLDPAGDPPDPYDNWLAEMRQIAADALQDAQDADASADAAAQSAEDAGDAAEEKVAPVVQKMIQKESHNLLHSDSDMTVGYVSKSGGVFSYNSYMYTPKISVAEGDVVRIYAIINGTFTQVQVRELCAYNDSNVAVSASGGEYITNYTVPSGIASVVLTISAATSVMVTKNYEATAYEEYFPPYYIAAYGFIENAMESYEVPEVPVAGYNLLRTGEDGVGFWDVSNGKPKWYNYTSFHYAIIPLKKNTTYYVNQTPRTYILVDEDGNVTEYGTVNGFTPQWKKYINSGNAVKLYLTLTQSAWTGGENTDFIVAEGLGGVRAEMKKPDFVSGLTQKNMDAKYACALPATSIRMTVGMPEKFYYKNILALPSNIVHVDRANGIAGWSNDGVTYNFTQAYIGSTSYRYRVYDENYSIVEEIIPSYAYGVADNLQNASALVIGDSTVAQVTMLQKMADGFTSRGKTLTLLGTRGTAPINHEGRAGWSAKNYCTNDAVSGVTNPFFNPSTEKFDYAYYMGNQGYSNPDFVVVQLGINDLYNMSFKDSDTAIETTAGYVKEIVDSILAYNSTQKILLNLPTAVNEDISRHTAFMPLVRNMFIRYNKYMTILATGYEKVRCSYCHLILDPTTDISDDVHPNAGGYEKMANEVISQFNCWQNQ